jgi:hypothetical protein
VLGCSPVQAPLPSPLPPNIPDTSVLAGRLKSCTNGSDVPPGTDCGETLADLLLEMQSYLHCVMSGFEISNYTGSCGILRVKKGKVFVEGLSVLIDECLSCLEPAKICAGKDKQVLTTVAGRAVWADPVGGGGSDPIDCAAILPLLQKDGCIEAGSDQRYSLGYDATSNEIQYFPYSSTGFIQNCADLRAKIETDCFTKLTTGTPTHTFGMNAAGVANWYPAATGTAAFITDCAGLKDKVTTCFTDATDTVTKALTIGASGVAWRPLPSGGGGGSSFITDCATFNTKLGECPPDAAAADSLGGMLGYTSGGGDAKIFPVIDPYHLEIRASTATVNGAAKTQVMTNTFGIQDVIGLWGDFGESGQGAASWYTPANGKVVIKRKGRYQVSWSVFARLVLSGGATLLGNIYSGMTIRRAATTYNGGTYRAEAAVFRGAQQNIYADGKQWDSALGGSITVVLNTGDELWMRVSVAQTSPGITISSFVLRDDNAAWFTLTELPDKLAKFA